MKVCLRLSCVQKSARDPVQPHVDVLVQVCALGRLDIDDVLRRMIFSTINVCTRALHLGYVLPVQPPRQLWYGTAFDAFLSLEECCLYLN